MTEQEAFNRVWQFFVVEKHPQSKVYRCCTAKGGGAACAYDSNGTRCAVGCLLGEDTIAKLTAESMLTVAIDSLIGESRSYHNEEVYSLLKRDLGDLPVAFLQRLQRCHDKHPFETTFTEQIETNLRQFSEWQGLRIPGIPA